MNFTRSEENYLKEIFHLQAGSGSVGTNDLAEILQTKPASVTDMLKKLSAKKLLNYKPYYGFSLSPEGKKAAIAVIRRHRLWEYFLSEKLEFGWEEVHSFAEDLEHVSSPVLIDRLDAFLGHPAFDPHGDPIPDKKGKLPNQTHLPLNKLLPTQVAKVSQVKNQSPEMLELLQHKNIGIGTRVEVKKQFHFDNSIEIKLKSGTTTISEQLASNIYVTQSHGS